MKIFFLLILCFWGAYLLDHSTENKTTKKQTPRPKMELQNLYYIKEESLKFGAEEESEKDKKITQ